MKITFRLIFFACILLSSHGLCRNTKQIINYRDSITGIYKSGRELIYINKKNHLFYIKRTAPKLSDVVNPECTDTIAKGNWQLIKNGILKLNNSTDFEKIAFNIEQQNIKSDSIYIKIVLPKDDAFFERRFEYEFHFHFGMGNFKSTKNIIVLPKQEVSRSKI